MCGNYRKRTVHGIFPLDNLLESRETAPAAVATEDSNSE